MYSHSFALRNPRHSQRSGGHKVKNDELSVTATCWVLSPEPVPAFKELTGLGRMERSTKVGSGCCQDLGDGIFTLHHRQGGGQSIHVPGGFSSGAVETTGQAGARQQPLLRLQIRQDSGVLRGGRRLATLELDCSHSSGRFTPMYPFYLFITYKLGVRLTLLKANKAGQRMGPPDRAAGVWGRETWEHRGGCGCSIGKGRRWKAGGGTSLQDSPSPEIPPLLWPSTSF